MEKNMNLDKGLMEIKKQRQFENLWTKIDFYQKELQENDKLLNLLKEENTNLEKEIKNVFIGFNEDFSFLFEKNDLNSICEKIKVDLKNLNEVITLFDEENKRIEYQIEKKSEEIGIQNIEIEKKGKVFDKNIKNLNEKKEMIKVLKKENEDMSNKIEILQKNNRNTYMDDFSFTNNNKSAIRISNESSKILAKEYSDTMYLNFEDKNNELAKLSEEVKKNMVLKKIKNEISVYENNKEMEFYERKKKLNEKLAVRNKEINREFREYQMSFEEKKKQSYSQESLNLQEKKLQNLTKEIENNKRIWEKLKNEENNLKNEFSLIESDKIKYQKILKKLKK